MSTEEPLPETPAPAPAPRPHRGRRILRRSGLGLAALLLLLVLAVVFLLGTESGTRILFTRLGALMPGSLAVEELRGAISSPLDIRGLTYEKEGLKVRIDHLRLRWRLRELLDRRLDIEQLYVDGVHVTSTPTAEQQPSPLPDVNLRFNIIVRDARVRGLTIGGEPAAAPLVIDSIDLRTTAIANVFRVDRLAVRSAEINADVTGTLQPQGDYPVDLHARWSVRPEGMAEIAGGGTLAGTLKELRVAQRVTAPFAVRLDALLTEPLHDLRFDARAAFQGANPRLLKPDLPDAPATGELTAKGSVEAFASSGTVRTVIAPVGATAVTYRLARQGDTWRIDRADATFPGTPMRATVAGQVTLAGEKGDEITGEGTIAWRHLAWPPREAKPAFASAAGELRTTIKGTTSDFASRGTLSAEIAPYGRLAALYDLARQGDIWRLERADLTVPGTPARLTARGQATVRGETVDLAARAAWRNLTWPLRGTPTVRSAAGSAQVSGSTDRYRARVQAEVAGPAGSAIPPGRWAIDGDGDKTSFRFRSLTGDVLAGRISGEGRVAWDPRVAWDVTLAGRELDPAALRPDFPGRVSFTAKSRGELGPQGQLAGSLAVSSLGGTLRGQPLAGNADVGLGDGRYDLKHLAVTWGPARVAASGLVGDRFDLAWEAAVPNLALAVPDVSGAVTGHGRVVGPARQPRIVADARVDSLQAAGQSAGRVDLSADVDLAPGGATRIDLTARQALLGGQAVKDLSVQARGTIERHTLALSATGLGTGDKAETEARLDAAFAGGLAGELGPAARWQGELTRLDLRDRTTGNWSLEKPAALTASAAEARLSSLCWRSGEARLCTEGGFRQNGPWTAQAALTALPLALLQPVLPAGSSLTGTVGGTFLASGNPQGVERVDVDLTPGPGELRYPAQDGKTLAVRFDRGSIRANAGPDGGDATANLTLPDLGGLTAEARLPGLARTGSTATLGDQPLAGRVQLHLSNLGFVAGLVPDLRDVSGRFDADYRLAGTVGSPRLTGEARLADGRARVPEYGLDLREIRLAIKGNGGGSLALDGAVRSGPGTVTLQGSTGLLPSPEKPLRLKVAGRRFQVMGTKEIDVQVAPDLDLAYDGKLARVTGQVDVPRAKVTIEKRPKGGAVPVSKDVVFVNGAPGGVETKPPLAVAARVRVVLGDDIDINVLGLVAKPHGSILAVEEPNRPPTATGEIEVSDGTFKAYGQDLTIERGRLIFAGGDLGNPGIDLRAYRKADDGTTAGIEAKGTLKIPVVTLWSEPAMTEAEALAYLLLGHPLGQASPEEGSLLANAATSLELKGGNLLAKKLGARFGLEKATIESKGGLDEASLMLGKYLSPRLYVVYGIGLFQPISTLQIRYILNKKLTLQAETGAGNSVDVLYTREH